LIVQPWLIQEIVSNGSSVRDVPIPLDGYVIQNTIDADNNQFFIFTYTNISDTASVRRYSHPKRSQALHSNSTLFLT